MHLRYGPLVAWAGPDRCRREYNGRRSTDREPGHNICIGGVGATSACFSEPRSAQVDQDTGDAVSALASSAPIAYIATLPFAECTVHPTGKAPPGGVAVADPQGIVRFFSPPVSWGTQLSAECTDGTTSTALSLDLTVSATFIEPPHPAPISTIRPPLTGDLKSYSQQWLVDHSYPMRPDPSGSPATYGAWRKAVAQRTTVMPPQPITAFDRFHGGSPAASGIWAGEILAQPNTQYVAVYAYFVLPDTFSSGLSSFWAGLDGWSGPDVIQSGVDATYNRNYAPWFEYYPGPTAYMRAPTVHYQDEVLVEAWSSPTTMPICPGTTFSATGDHGCGWIENITTGVASGTYGAKNLDAPGNKFTALTAEFINERLCSANCKSTTPTFIPLSNFQQIWMSGEALDYNNYWHDYATDSYLDLTMENSSNQTLSYGMNSNGTDTNVITYVSSQ